MAFIVKIEQRENTMNEAKYLRSSVQRLLNIESLMAEKGLRQKAIQWQLLVSCGGLKIVVGKGDVNTCFLSIEDKRKAMYPEELTAWLDKFAERKYVCYYAADSTNLKDARFVSEACLSLKQARQNKNAKYILGVTHSDVFETVLVRDAGLLGNSWKEYETR